LGLFCRASVACSAYWVVSGLPRAPPFGHRQRTVPVPGSCSAASSAWAVDIIRSFRWFLDIDWRARYFAFLFQEGFSAGHSHLCSRGLRDKLLAAPHRTRCALTVRPMLSIPMQRMIISPGTLVHQSLCCCLESRWASLRNLRSFLLHPLC
jgi:hypothetical protein